MDKMKRHPISIQKDALTRALIICGFKLQDYGTAPEIEIADWAVSLYPKPSQLKCKPVTLEGGNYALRSELLAAKLSSISGPLPIKIFSAGRVFDGKDAAYPQRTRIEGVWATNEHVAARLIKALWARIAKEAFGINAITAVEAGINNSYSIHVTLNGASFPLAYMAKANALGRALLSPASSNNEIWFFAIDVDQVSMDAYGILTRDKLYSPLLADLQQYTTDAYPMDDEYYAKAIEVLEDLGFVEFSGLKVYEADCYKKMNMFQGAWDKNNRGVQLDEPLGNYTGLPTVLTPSLEEALAANFRAGEKSCRLFEFGHISLPQEGGAPKEKISLSFGAYGPDLDNNGWRALVDQFFNEFGIKNHFFIPIPGQAIAYNDACVFIVMDQNMKYQESNFGGIAPKALENHGIGVPAWMAQFEFSTSIEPKAMEEFDFIPPEML